VVTVVSRCPVICIAIAIELTLTSMTAAAMMIEGFMSRKWFLFKDDRGKVRLWILMRSLLTTFNDQRAPTAGYSK
jgi:hypothetical protein